MRQKLGWILPAAAALLVFAACRPAGAPPIQLVPTVTAPSRPTEAPVPVTPAENPAATPGPMPAPGGLSGAKFTAQLGPTCPGPERPGQVCTKPYQGMLAVKDAKGAAVAQVQTDENGKAALNLPPGEYVVTPIVEGPFPRGAPVTFTVQAGQYTEVSIELDTGIR